MEIVAFGLAGLLYAFFLVGIGMVVVIALYALLMLFTEVIPKFIKSLPRD